MKSFWMTISAVMCLSALAAAQAPPAPAPSNQLTTQVLADMLRTATGFHDFVQNLNLNKSLGPDVHTIGPNGLPQHSVARTAVAIGAGAGVGAALGQMSHNPNSVLIGAFIGGAGGLIVDEIVKHREQTHPKPVLVAPAPVPVP